MRQPPSPLLLSARRRRPRRNPPRGMQFGDNGSTAHSPQAQAQAGSDEKCVLLERDRMQEDAGEGAERDRDPTHDAPDGETNVSSR